MLLTASARGRVTATMLWRRQATGRLLPAVASSVDSPIGPSSGPSWITTAGTCSGRTANNVMAVRHFSAKNRKRKEERRKKRDLKKQLQGEETQREEPASKPEPPTVDEAKPSLPPVVTQTKAGSLTDTTTTNTTTNSSPTITVDGVTVAAAAPDDEEEEEFVPKYSLPDREKETELIQRQTQVSQLYKEGRYQQGLELAEETLAAMKEHYTTDEFHPATASAYLNVGLFHKQLGHFDKAKDHYQHALQGYQETVGTDHASYAMVLHNLGILHQSQIHFDSNLKATERLRLMEQALEYLERAYQIRKVELPPAHPHIVATQSAMGMTLTAHILHQHKPVSTQGDKAADKVVPMAASYRSVLPPHVTEQSWEAAELHLRTALDKALRNPKGESSLKRADRNHYLNLQRKQALHQKHHTTKDKQNEKQDDNTHHPPLQTSSAATSAQNLAVFLKARSTTIETIRPQYKAWVKEAEDLYQTALQVRMALLPKGHPDIYITQYSLAELYEYTGQEELAQALRQTILDTYDPPTQQQQEEQQQEQKQ
ncbi:repeat-containing protein [Seminavis robusta]|uniref:Repeat-containing protein n=1 Tax=Seminavis robusta TaxID=568900 RepID=A0A9N8EUS8_9STRA|nr:repeat-containing protein [Seminavis robusta]|eukprot:Sro1823_g299880.1 repeat-containing protein (542) ;mRNA; r:4646-6271